MLSPHVPDLPGLQLLLAVANCGSINGAATEVGITQQAASQRLRALETRVGLGLLSRGSHGSQLTESGILLAQWASRVIEAAEQLDVAIASLRTDRQAELHVAASLTLAEHLVPRWLVAFSAGQKRAGTGATRVRLTAENSTSVCQRVLAGQADVGFVEGPSVPVGLRSRIVATDHLMLVARPDHPWAQARKVLTVPELAGTPLVSRERGSGTRGAFLAALDDWVSAAGGGMDIAAPAVELSSSAAVRAAVVAGAGAAVLSELAVADDLAAGKLVKISVPDLNLTRSLRAVWVGSSSPPAGPGRDLVNLATRL